MPPTPPRCSLDLPTGATVALTCGSYDRFNVGHVRLFERIERRFEFLVVAVCTDEFDAVSGRQSAMPFEDRLEMARGCRHVDLDNPETGWGQKKIEIVHYGAAALVMCSDSRGRFDHLDSLTEAIHLPPEGGSGACKVDR